MNVFNSSISSINDVNVEFANITKNFKPMEIKGVRDLIRNLGNYLKGDKLSSSQKTVKKYIAMEQKKLDKEYKEIGKDINLISRVISKHTNEADKCSKKIDKLANYIGGLFKASPQKTLDKRENAANALAEKFVNNSKAIHDDFGGKIARTNRKVQSINVKAKKLQNVAEKQVLSLARINELKTQISNAQSDCRQSLKKLAKSESRHVDLTQELYTLETEKNNLITLENILKRKTFFDGALISNEAEVNKTFADQSTEFDAIKVSIDSAKQNMVNHFASEERIIKPSLWQMFGRNSL